MIQFQYQVIRDKRIDLVGRESYYLGPDLTLEGCTVVLNVSAKALTISRVRFVKCRIEAKRSLSDFYWLDAHLSGCVFVGRFNGSDFGHLPGDFDLEGGIEHCDFSAAILDGCRFIGCDALTIRFPRWPCFTILDPVARLPELQAANWPGDADILVENIAQFPASTVAVTHYAPAIEKDLGADQAALRAVLEQLGRVVM